MSKPLLVIIILISIGAGIGLTLSKGSLGDLLSQRQTVPSPFAACSPASEADARIVAEAVESGFNTLDGTKIDAVLDLPTLFGQAIHDVRLSGIERRGFIQGAIEGANGDNNIAKRWIAALGEKDRVRLLRIRQVDGHQRAQLRMLVGDGLNYLDLLIVRTPAGVTRVVDYQDMATGEFLSRTIASVAIPALAQASRTPLERLVKGSSNEYLGMVGTVPEIRGLIEQGKHAEAMERWRGLPEAFRSTRAGATLRMLIAQGMGDAEHLASLQEIERLFPNDPALSLVQVDANILAKRYPQALEAVDRVDQIVGGDPYLDGMRADIRLQAGDLAGSQKDVARGCEREPGLIDLWWTRLGVSLKADTHAETARALDEINQRFGIEFQDDLGAVAEYARFAASPEHAAWRARQAAKTATPPATPPTPSP